jgi:acyl carrier protein
MDRSTEPLAEQKTPAFVPPRTPMEKRLAEIWIELLAIKSVGIHDDFFQLGGHSQLLVRLQLKLEEITHQQVPVAALFEHATIASLSRYVEELTTGL